MSILSGTLGAVLGAKSQKDATQATERNVQATNAANILLDIMARGGTIPAQIGGIKMPAELVGKSSAVLPYYFGGAESDMASAAVQMFNASLGGDYDAGTTTVRDPRYADPVNGAQNEAADRRRLAQLENEVRGRDGVADWLVPALGEEKRRQIAVLQARLNKTTTSTNVRPDTGAALQNMIRHGEGIVDKYEPQVEAGDQLISDVFSGDVTRAMLDEAAPVQASRIKLANMEKDAGIEALQDKLNEIRTIQAKKGFTGDSLTKHRLEFDARRRIGTDSARAMGGAELENASETARIKGAGRDLQFKSLDAPFNRAGQRLNLDNLPTLTAQQRFSAAMAPMQFFRTGGANFQVQGPPERSSVPGAGQIALTGLGSAGATVGRALLDRTRTSPEVMAPTVTGPNGQLYYNTGNSYAPAGGMSAGAAATSAWQGAAALEDYEGAFEALSGG